MTMNGYLYYITSEIHVDGKLMNSLWFFSMIRACDFRSLFRDWNREVYSNGYVTMEDDKLYIHHIVGSLSNSLSKQLFQTNYQFVLDCLYVNKVILHSTVSKIRSIEIECAPVKENDYSDLSFPEPGVRSMAAKLIAGAWKNYCSRKKQIISFLDTFIDQLSVSIIIKYIR